MAYGQVYDNPFSVTYEYPTVDFGATSDTVLRIPRPHRLPSDATNNRDSLGNGLLLYAGGKVLGAYINGLVTEAWADDNEGARIYVGTGTSATLNKNMFDSGPLQLDAQAVGVAKAYYFDNLLAEPMLLERGVYIEGNKKSGSNTDLYLTCQNCDDSGTEAGQARIVGVIMQWHF